MAEQVVKIDNVKYAREKRRKEAVAAWLFLLPNFLGFMIITFFPIFATFFLSFTEWDGISLAAPAQLKVVMVTKDGNPANETIKLEKGTVLTMKTKKTSCRRVSVVVPFKLNSDIVIPAGSTEYGFLNINALKQWTFYKDAAGNPLVSPIVEDVEKDLQQYIKEFKIFLAEDNILSANPRLSDTKGVRNIGVAINMGNVDKEITLTLKKRKKDIVIPAGTVFLVDMFISKIIESKNILWHFKLPKSMTLKKGKVETSNPVKIIAEENGLIGGNTYIVKRPFETDAKIGNAKVKVKFVMKTGNNGLRMVGFENYRALIVSDLRFRYYLGNTLIFLIEIPLGMLLSLIMAMAMNQPLKGIVIFRVLYFIPVISNIVAIALLWRWLLNSDVGMINTALRAIGVMNPPRWFAHKGWAKVAIMIVDVWKGAGYNMMLYLAGLQGIPHYLYEAADIDGATGMQQFWNITWPLLGPTNFFILIMGIIGGFQAFGTQYVMTGGGPAGSTTTVVYYIYNNAYKWGNMGYATAAAVILFFFVMIITIINWRISESQVEY